MRSQFARASIALWFLIPSAPAIADTEFEHPVTLAPTPPDLTLHRGGPCVDSGGDFNGDGFDDLVTGRYVYFGGPGLDANPDVTLGVNPASVAFVGDVNGDGYDDLVAGVPYADAGAVSEAGRAYLFFGGPIPDGIADLTVSGVANWDHLGTAVGAAGDVNRDGLDDFIVGIPGSDVAGFERGQAWVMFGGRPPSSSPGMILMSPGPGAARFGWSVGAAGDVNGDGAPELLIGLPDTDGARGSAFVWPIGWLAGSNVAGFFGWSVTAGDVDRDGFSDVVVAAQGVGQGRAFVYLGAATFGTTPAVTLRPGAGARGFGWSVTSGDLDGDGHADVVAGAPYNFDLTAPGRAYAFFGGDPMNAVVDALFEGRPGDTRFGWAVAAGGDLDGNGQDDLVVANDLDAAYVFLSRFNRPPDCSAATAGFEGGWPPNFLLSPVSIDGVTDPDGDEVLIRVTGITADEAPGGRGNFCPDASIDDDGVARVRNERDGKGNGRVYAIAFTATDAQGASCDGVVRVCVPHAQGAAAPCIDDGQRFDALGPCDAPIFAEPEAAVTAGLETVESSARGIVFAYAVDRTMDVAVAVYDVTGRRVAALDAGVRAAGSHRAIWDTGAIPPGVYLAVARLGDRLHTRRVTVVR